MTTIDTVDENSVGYRPRRIRWVAGPAAVAVVVLFTVLSFGLTGATGNGMGQFARGDQTAMIGLGVLIGLGILAFTRPRVRADAAGVRIRNVVGSYELPWAVVRAVRFDRNSPWATLELHDDETVPIHALQAVDKEYAVGGVRALRALHAGAADVRS
jgi:Bacterial PH domain